MLYKLEKTLGHPYHYRLLEQYINDNGILCSQCIERFGAKEIAIPHLVLRYGLKPFYTVDDNSEFWIKS